MASQAANIDKMLRIPAFVSYGNVLATNLNNEATRQAFEMDKLGMMDVKTLNSVFSEYSKNARANAPRF